MAVAILAKIVKRAVPRRFGRTVWSEAAAGLGDRVKMSDEVRQPLGAYFDLIAVDGAALLSFRRICAAGSPAQ